MKAPFKVNGYECGIYGDGEVYIKTDPKQLEANSGIVFLTVLELSALLMFLKTDPSQPS